MGVICYTVITGRAIGCPERRNDTSKTQHKRSCPWAQAAGSETGLGGCWRMGLKAINEHFVKSEENGSGRGRREPCRMLLSSVQLAPARMWETGNAPSELTPLAKAVSRADDGGADCAYGKALTPEVLLRALRRCLSCRLRAE